jgi:hypothetical protein
MHTLSTNIQMHINPDSTNDIKTILFLSIKI